MATAQPSNIVPVVDQPGRTTLSHTSPRASPRLSSRSSPRISPRASPLRIGRRTVSSRVGAPIESSKSSTPYYHSLKEGHWLGQFLVELTTKNSEIANLLRLNRGQHISKVLLQQLEKKQELINSYREFLDSLVSLVAQSVFLKNPELVTERHDPQGVVQALCAKKCPDLNIFRRLVIEPSLTASTNPDSATSQRYNGVPINQLARFCDVAVLKFLDGINEHTKPQAVLWAIDYISNLLHSLLSSIALHSSSGWYGAPSTRQKKTVSVNVPPFLLPAPPTVVVVASPPPLDPETGQPQIRGGTSTFRFPPQSHRSGEEEPHLSTHASSSESNHLESRGSLGLSGKVSPVLPISPTWSGNSSPMLSPQHTKRGLGEDGGVGMLGNPYRPRSPRLADLKFNQHQSIPEEEEEEGGKASAEGTGKPNAEGTGSEQATREVEKGHSDGGGEEEGEGGGGGKGNGGEDADEEVKAKPIASLQTVPDVDLKAELELYITTEGRISLIAILQAIARLPQSDIIWTERLGMNCFQLIQHCMDLGLAQSSKAARSSSSQKRQRFQKQENTAFLAHGKDPPFQLHSRYIVHYAVHALIQCATNLLIGCSHDLQQTCWLAYKHVGTQNNLIHPRLLRQLNRIHCHSPQEFQRVMLHFASTAPLRKALHFLHVVLEYCQLTSAEKVDSLLLSIVSSVLRALVDRLAQLDLSKPSLQDSLVSDVCLFMQYAQNLFNFHPQLGSYKHFHMYIHRVALSVVLPQQEPKSEPLSESILQPFPVIFEEADYPPLHGSLVNTPQLSSGFAVRGSKVTQSLPRKLKQKASEEKLRPRSSVQSDHIIVTKSPKAHRRGLFTKQQSIHEREDSSFTLQGVSGLEAPGGMEEWRRLKLSVLRQRIQRLVVLMDLSEPGTIPDPGMLSSLIDLSDGTLVVARAMVLLECALFVRKLRTRDGSSTSHWLRNRQEGHYRIAVHFKRWAVAIGEKLRIIELRERDKIQQLQRKDGGRQQPIVLPEEPVLPDSPAEQDRRDDKGSTKFRTVSFGIKMCACVLLHEITHYLRDNVNTTVSLGTPRVSITNLTSGSRPSLISSTSTDTDAVATPTPGATGALMQSLDSKTLGIARHRLTPDIRSSSLEEETVHSIYSPSLDGGSFEEEHPESPRKRVSVYLRVNSASDQRDLQRGRVNSGLKQTINVTSSEAGKTSAPPKRRSSVSVSVGRRHVSFYKKRSDENPVMKGRTSVTVNTLRPVPGKTTVKASQSFQEAPPDSISPSDSLHRPKLQSQGSTASQKNLGAQIQSGISRLARRAFRGKIRHKSTAGPRKSSIAGSSPNLIQRKRPQRLSTAGLSMGMEDDRHFPWVEIVEHLVVVDALNPDSHARHSQACIELVTALNHVYGQQEGSEKESQNSGPSLTSLFSAVWDPFLHQRERVGLDAARGTQLRRTGKHKPPRSVSTAAFSSQSVASSVSSSHSMASLDFSQIRHSIFWSPSSSQYTAIELFLEQDSEHPEIQIDTRFSRARRSYMQEGFAGLMHAPLSLLVYTAPLLSSSSFSSLKDIVWGQILDRNQELAQAAGMFFLLTAAREGESIMKEFFAKRVENETPEKQREAVMRFMVLWKARYKVWPAIGERGQKRFNSERAAEERKDKQTIGYSLPTNLLGSAGREVPVPPWKALSLCVHDDCHTNPDKCYRATRLAPLKHCKEVSEAVQGFSISGISISLEADSRPTSVFAGVGSEDNAGNININQWEAVEPTLFPTSLLPLISFVISSLTPSHSGHSSTKSHTSLSFPLSLNRSELAYQAVRQCMIDDPRLLFRPLLNRFNRLYQEISDRASHYRQTVFIKSLKEILHPLHVILQSFPSLPPKAAHFLFNSFIGIITRHTDQPCTFSSEIIQSVLLLLTMVIPSVKGLDLKALKTMLKKESCYTTILTTARIRGTEKIHIIDETIGSNSKSIVHDQSVDADDTFGQVIAQFKGTQLSYDLLQNLYLVDQSKDLPVLSMLVVKDHYSMLSDKQFPTFVLREAQRGSGREVWSWGDQMNQLFVHKMSEVLRVLMIFKLLLTGPEVERGSIEIYNKFAQPNYRFLHQELVALTSFPRQALTSILYEAGPASLSHHHLRSSDSMLMGTWVKFVLGLFAQIKQDYDWENSLGLFLNVVNGALLLYSEDLSILRQALAALVVVASKFVHVFRRHGYEMVTPTLIQVYASHMTNKVITNALKFVWGQFYMLNLDSNVFVLQAIAATATLLSEEAAKLSASSSTPLRPSLLSQQLSPAVAQCNNVRAAFQLLQSLDSESPPQDDLHIMSNCPMEQRMLDIHWQPLTLQTTFYLCITVASWNPEAVRGMQVLVFMDHLIQMFLSGISLPRTSSFVLESMKSLVKGCNAITKPHSWKGDFLSGRRDTQRTDTQHNLDLAVGEGDVSQQPHKSVHTPRNRRSSSAVAKIYRRIANPGKTPEVSEGSAYFLQSNLDKAMSSLQPMGHNEYVGGFKRRLQATNQRVLQLSRESLLSLSSKMVLHEATQLRERSGAASKSVVRLDAQTTAYLTAIAVQLLKLGGSNEDTLTSQGLCSFMESLLPNIEWTDAHFSSFHNIVSRLVKLFRMLCRVRVLLAWDGLVVFLKGITQCIKTCERLATQEQIFVKLKMLLEVTVRAPVQGGGGEGTSNQEGSVGRRRPLLHFAPPSFTEAIVKLISQLMVTTKDAPHPRLQYHLSDLLSQKLAIKDTIVPKILLPLCIHLGLREDLKRLPEQDLEFLLQLLDKKVENILKLSRPPLHPSHFMDPSHTDIPADMFFRAIKVFCCAFSESFALKDWSLVVHWITSLSLRRLEGLRPSQSHDHVERTRSAASLLGSPSSSLHTSVSGQCNFDSYLAFYKALLIHVYEGLLSVHRIPLFSFLWPLLGQLESQLSEVEKSVKVESPAQLQGFRNLIEKCQALKRQGQNHTARSKNDLLTSYRDELKSPNSRHKFKRASTITERPRLAKHPKRKLSYQHSLPSIGEESAGSVGKGGERRKRSDARPTFLKFSTPPLEENRGKRTAVVMKGEDFKKRPLRSSAGEASTKASISSSDGITSFTRASQSSSGFQPKRTALKKYVASHNPTPLSPLTSPPVETSPRRARKPKKPPKVADKPSKNPPLSQLRDDSKFTSSEFQADVEDFDAISPMSVDGEDKQTETYTVTANQMALNPKSAATSLVTVEAEVHLEARERHKLETKETSVSSVASLILPPPPSPRSSSRSASPVSSPSLAVRPFPTPTPSPPLITHSPRDSPLPNLPSTAAYPVPQEGDAYSHDCSSDFLIPRKRTDSSPPPPSNSSPHESSPCDTETDTDTLLPRPTSGTSGGSLPRGKALSPISSPTSSRRKLSFVKQGSGKSKSGSIYLNAPSLGEDSDC